MSLHFLIDGFPSLDSYQQEAFNTLCTNLSFADVNAKRILVTSCFPGEGKTFVSVHLMRAFAGLGKRVVLIDADLRASQMTSAYGVRIVTDPNTVYPGLARYLASKCELGDILGPTNIKNASMILPGKMNRPSLQLLNMPRMKTMMEKLGNEFDIVIVDTPPVGTIVDAARIAPHCDGALLVVKSDATPRAQLRKAILQIEKSGCPILGTVLNQYEPENYMDKYYSDKYYSEGYLYGDK